MYSQTKRLAWRPRMKGTWRSQSWIRLQMRSQSAGVGLSKAAIALCDLFLAHRLSKKAVQLTMIAPIIFCG